MKKAFFSAIMALAFSAGSVMAHIPDPPGPAMFQIVVDNQTVSGAFFLFHLPEVSVSPVMSASTDVLSMKTSGSALGANLFMTTSLAVDASRIS